MSLGVGQSSDSNHSNRNNSKENVISYDRAKKEPGIGVVDRPS